MEIAIIAEVFWKILCNFAPAIGLGLIGMIALAISERK